MATSGIEHQMRVPESLKKQLVLALRSIQWSYTIFWTISFTQPGILEWGDGYYNGDIKTRKTIHAVELNSDQLGLQRSDQLRELYESLSAGQSNPQASKRPSAALSPEDLTDTEWYYLVCMSFVFKTGEGLPGKTLATNQPMWLCNAHCAESKVFSRSLLAKSAHIQTVVCFPFSEGVVELGVTELVPEDPSFIENIKTSFLEIPYPANLNESSCIAGNRENDQDPTCAALGSPILDATTVPVMGFEVSEMASPNNSSNNNENYQPAEDSLMAEGMNGVDASQELRWQFMDEELDDCFRHPIGSSDCISKTFVDAEKFASASRDSNIIDHCLQEVQECNHSKITSPHLQSSDFHYQSVLSSLLNTSSQLVPRAHLQNRNKISSFVSWKRGGLTSRKKQRHVVSQKLLKKILFEVPQMINDRLLEPREESDFKDDIWKLEAAEIDTSHAISERRRREKLNEKFVILKSLVPSISKFDKVSILDETIDYLQGLERKVEELKSRRAELEASTKRKPKDSVERLLSDYYGNTTKPFVNKRKTRGTDTSEIETEFEPAVAAANVIVSRNEDDVLVEIECPWREGILLEFMDAIRNLHLDSHWVQSSTHQGILSLAIKTKYKGSNGKPAGMIRQSLQRVAWKC